jgi:lysozyme
MLVSLATSEGFRGDTYIPVKGDVPTIGFGETHGVKAGQHIDPVRALIMLNNDVDVVKHELVKKCMDMPLSFGEEQAVLDLAYNEGANTVCYRHANPDEGPTMLVTKFRAGDYAGGCLELLSFNHFHGHTLASLTARRQRNYNTCVGVK